MMKRTIYLVAATCIFLGLTTAKSSAQFVLDSTVLDTSTVITGLDIPWEVAWGPDGWLWVTERYGRVSRIHPDNGTQDVILDISGQIYEQGEAGLLGLAIHSDAVDSLNVYLVYTYQQGFDVFERLVRYSYDGNALVNPIVLVDSIEGNSTHDGSRLILTPDGKLMMTTGDAQNQPLSQNFNSLNGKILRMDLDGGVPADNPVSGSLVWSLGHRNAQGLLWAPNGVLYSSEHGPQTDDELNIIQKGANYGWPDVRGYCDDPGEMPFCSDSNVVEPIAAWTPTIAPSDIAWYDHPAIPEWQGNILMSVLKDQVIVEMELNASGDAVTGQRRHFEDDFGRIRDVCVAPDGRVFIATNGQSWVNTNPFTHKIIQLKNNAYTDTLTSNQSPAASAAVRIVPNPVRGRFVIHMGPQSKFERIGLLNEIGQMVLEKTIDGIAELELDVRHLAGGTYFAVLQGADVITVQKIILH